MLASGGLSALNSVALPKEFSALPSALISVALPKEFSVLQSVLLALAAACVANGVACLAACQRR